MPTVLDASMPSVMGAEEKRFAPPNASSGTERQLLEASAGCVGGGSVPTWSYVIAKAVVSCRTRAPLCGVGGAKETLVRLDEGPYKHKLGYLRIPLCSRSVMMRDRSASRVLRSKLGDLARCH